MSNFNEMSKSSYSVADSAGNDNVAQRVLVDQYKKLPRTLLSAPLRPDLAGLLSENDRRQYNIQKIKWEAEQRKLDKARVFGEPRDRVYDEDAVKAMVEGSYWDDSDDEDGPGKGRQGPAE